MRFLLNCDGSGSAAHADSSGHSPPPYAPARLSSVSRVAYTGIRFGVGAHASFDVDVEVADDGVVAWSGPGGFVFGLGGIDPDNRMRDTAWSRCA